MLCTDALRDRRVALAAATLVGRDGRRMNQGDDYVGDLLQVADLDESERLRRQRATVRRLMHQLQAGIALLPSDAGTFWRSEAHRAYARRLQDLRRMLVHANASLREADSSIDAALLALSCRGPAP